MFFPGELAGCQPVPRPEYPEMVPGEPKPEVNKGMGGTTGAALSFKLQVVLETFTYTCNE